MPTNYLERIQKKATETSQKEARLAQEKARLKEDVKNARVGMIRAGGLFDLDPERLHLELLLMKSLRDLAGTNVLDIASLHRELLDVAKSKARRDARSKLEPPPQAIAAE